MNALSRLVTVAGAIVLAFSLVACKSDNKTADAKPKYSADSCCAKAVAAGKTCDHPCCADAAKAGGVCKKCNPT